MPQPRQKDGDNHNNNKHSGGAHQRGRGEKGGQVHKKVTVQSAERRRGSGIYIIKLMDVNFTLASGVGE